MTFSVLFVYSATICQLSLLPKYDIFAKSLSDGLGSFNTCKEYAAGIYNGCSIPPPTTCHWLICLTDPKSNAAHWFFDNEFPVHHFVVSSSSNKFSGSSPFADCPVEPKILAVGPKLTGIVGSIYSRSVILTVNVATLLSSYAEVALTIIVGDNSFPSTVNIPFLLIVVSSPVACSTDQFTSLIFS